MPGLGWGISFWVQARQPYGKAGGLGAVRERYPNIPEFCVNTACSYLSVVYLEPSELTVP